MSDDRLTEDEMREIGVLATAASARPWRAACSALSGDELVVGPQSTTIAYLNGCGDGPTNARYIVAACNGAPCILAALHEMTAERDRWRRRAEAEQTLRVAVEHVLLLTTPTTDADAWLSAVAAESEARAALRALGVEP